MDAKRLLIDALALGLLVWTLRRAIAAVLPYSWNRPWGTSDVNGVIGFSGPGLDTIIPAALLVGLAYWRFFRTPVPLLHALIVGLAWLLIHVGLDRLWVALRYPRAQIVYPDYLVAFYILAGLAPLLIWGLSRVLNPPKKDPKD